MNKKLKVIKNENDKLKRKMKNIFNKEHTYIEEIKNLKDQN